MEYEYEINLKQLCEYCKIYKNSLVVKNTLGPYCWIKQSYDNYIWTSKLGLALINEYKLRYNNGGSYKLIGVFL